MHKVAKASLVAACLLLGGCPDSCDPSNPAQPFGTLVVRPPSLDCKPAPGISQPGQFRLAFSIDGGQRGQPYRLRVDFGDGTPAIIVEGVEAFEPEPRTLDHAYLSPGRYSVDVTGRNQVTLQDVACTVAHVADAVPIIPEDAVGLDCKHSPSRGPAPLSVNFQMRCPGPCEPLWDFGDGTSPALQRNVGHRYDRPGRYLARGSARDPGGRVTHCPDKPVDVVAPPLPGPPPYSPPPASPSPSPSPSPTPSPSPSP